MLANGLGLAVLPEHAVIKFNGNRPPVSLSVLPLDPAPKALDFPFVVLAPATSARGTAAERLLAEMRTPAAAHHLASAGLRTAEGQLQDASPMPTSAATIIVDQLTATGDAIQKALGLWRTVALPGRTLFVIDVSGSMTQREPTAGNQTRMSLTAEAAWRAIGLFDDGWAVACGSSRRGLRGTGLPPARTDRPAAGPAGGRTRGAERGGPEVQR